MSPTQSSPSNKRYRMRNRFRSANARNIWSRPAMVSLVFIFAKANIQDSKTKGHTALPIHQRIKRPDRGGAGTKVGWGMPLGHAKRIISGTDLKSNILRNDAMVALQSGN